MEKNYHLTTLSGEQKLEAQSVFTNPSQTKGVKNDEIYFDREDRNNQIPRNSQNKNILSEKREIFKSQKENITPWTQDEEKEYCEICSEDILAGEIVNYCSCLKFYHPNCLILLQTKRGQCQKSCEVCGVTYRFGNYKHTNQTDSTLEKSIKSNNVSLMDTNINNLDNYSELQDVAFQMSHEGFAQMMLKNENLSGLNNTNSLTEEIGRIALSPIVLTNTPYSGKTKKQICSNQKVEEYIKMQNTHTTPSNYRHINISDLSEVPQAIALNYEQSPETSFQGIRQHLTFYSPNTVQENNPSTRGKSLYNPLQKEEVNFDIDKFFGSLNNDLYSLNDYSNNNFSVNNHLSFRKIVFDESELEESKENITSNIMNNFKHLKDSTSKDNYNFSHQGDQKINPNTFTRFQTTEKENEEDYDKENSPPLPRESSKYSYPDPETIFSLSPVEINIEAGLSHLVSDVQRIVEIPISIDINLKDNFSFKYSRDYVLIFNTQSLNIKSVYDILKVLFERISDNSHILTNVLKINQWISKEELSIILFDQAQFENLFNNELSYLNYSEIAKLINYSVELSFEHHSNIFSIILLNDLDEINLNVDYYDELKNVTNKLTESQVNLMKNFTINSIILDHGKTDTLKSDKTIKFLSFFYELTMLSMGLFFAPKDFNELNKSIYTCIDLLEQSELLNLKANLKGNKDPSVFIDCLNYPKIKKSHNHYEIFLGSLLKKEKKFLNLTAVVILNNQNVTLNLPILEINLEFLSEKQRENSVSLMNGSSNLIRSKTPFYQISIPILNKNKEVVVSNSLTLRHCAAKIADMIGESLDLVTSYKYDQCLSKLYETKAFFESSLKNQPGLIRYFKTWVEANNTSSINLNMNSVHFYNSKILNSTCISNTSMCHDDSLNELVKNFKQSKIFNFCYLILSDLNNLIDMIKNRNFNSLAEFFTIKYSLTFYRPVHLSDERFFDDVIDQF